MDYIWVPTQARPITPPGMRPGCGLYHRATIHNYFWCGEARPRRLPKSKFYGSYDFPTDLSYMLISGTSSYWDAQRVVFANTQLKLLPQYIERKVMHSVSAAQQKEADESNEEASTSTKNSSTQDDSAILREARTEALAQGVGDMSSKTSNPPPSPSGGSPSSGESISGEYIFVGPDGETQSNPIPTSSSSATTSSNVQTSPDYATSASEYHPPKPEDLPNIAPIAYAIDYTHDRAAHPIAVFQERQMPGRVPGGANALFVLKGWFVVTRVSILAPFSSKTASVIYRNWGLRDVLGNPLPGEPRDRAAWYEALASEWAAVMLRPARPSEIAPIMKTYRETRVAMDARDRKLHEELYEAGSLTDCIRLIEEEAQALSRSDQLNLADYF